MRVLAIDPGTEQSGWVLAERLNCAPGGVDIIDCDVTSNESLILDVLSSNTFNELVIERVACYGMAVGESVFETVFWSGRFAQAALPIQTTRIGRRDIKLHLCGSPRAKDGNIRQALLDRFGGDKAAKGTKAQPGPLYGVRSHVWAALALAVTWADTLAQTDTMIE